MGAVRMGTKPSTLRNFAREFLLIVGADSDRMAMKRVLWSRTDSEDVRGPAALTALELESAALAALCDVLGMADPITMAHRADVGEAAADLCFRIEAWAQGKAGGSPASPGAIPHDEAVALAVEALEASSLGPELREHIAAFRLGGDPIWHKGVASFSSVNAHKQRRRRRARTALMATSKP